MSRSTRFRPESADPFAMQLALSRVHARLVPMQRSDLGYALDSSAKGWIELPPERGFAGYGLGRALRMLLDVLRGLTALHDTFDAEGVNFAHGEVALTQFRVDSEGVCRLVPLTKRHSSTLDPTPATEVLGHLAPERLLGEPVDARADVFSAGVLLWEALAGRRLFNESSADAIIERLMGEKLPMPQLPPELAWAIPLKSIATRALSVDPYQRFADCAELATAIAIVARERVASHGEIAAFFGSKGRSLNSVAQPRPVPTRSSTFPSVSLPAVPHSVSAPPSSRNGFPLATSSPRTVTPPPRSVTLGPRSLTPAPQSLTPAPQSLTLAPGSITPVPQSLTPVPQSLTPAPYSLAPSSLMPDAPVSSSVRGIHKSPFATLLGAGENLPASQRRKTLTSVATPLSALDPFEAAAPSSSPPSSSLLPPLPVWAASMPAVPAPPSQGPTSSSAVVARATLESIPLAEEVAKLRGWSARRSLIVLTLLALVAGLVALVALQSGDEGSDRATNQGTSPLPLAAPGAAATRIAAPEPAATSDDDARQTPAPPSASDPNNGAPASNQKELHPVSKPASPRPAGNTKDYGI
jgi:serine/threonine-protein kinase